MNDCKHLSRVGDNYGESCQDCGQQLSGFGFGGWFGANITGNERCIHSWTPASTDVRYCIYCEQWEDGQEVKATD